MYLKSLEMQGFKSFPDKIKLSFHEGITAVVGPNGSGKSNVSDAIRWVLGEQSTKTLRGAKMEDVIFIGSKNRKPQGFAEVSLTLDNRGSDRLEGFEGEEITVSRRLYRSGESEYRINHQQVRLKDVYELFMDTGLGRDGYSMIGQGRISEIISAKSTQRREIFEEASGISKYRYRKQEAQRKLISAEENLLRLRDIASELEGRIAPLLEQKQKAEKFLLLSEEKKQLEVSLWTHQLSRIQEELSLSDNKISYTRSSYEELSGELDELDRRVEEIYSSSASLSACAEEARTLVEALEEQAARSDSEIAVIENNISHTENKIEEIQLQVEGAGGHLSAADAAIALKQNELLQKQANKDTLSEQLSKTEEELSALLSRSDTFLSEHSDLSDRLVILSEQHSKGLVAEASCRAALANITEDKKRVTGELAALREEVEKLSPEHAECKQLLSTIEEQIEELQNSKKGYLSLKELKTQKTQKAKQHFEETSLKIKELEHRKALLTELERNMEGFSHSVKALLARSKDGALRGILGPVSSLLQTDKQYNIAIETALGGAMQHVVVENEQTAKSAIAYLKSASAGRATFLPLTSIKSVSLNDKGIEQCDGFVGIAKEILSYDTKYEAIFSSLLSRTVITEDIHSAVEMAKKYGYRFRIVTLDGQLINAGGSMTGGSVAKSAGLLSRSAELKELDRILAALAQDYEQARDAAEKATAEESVLDASVRGLDAEFTTLQEDKNRYLAVFSRLEATLERLSAQTAAAEESLGKLTLRDTEYVAITVRLEAEREALLMEKTELETQLLSLSGHKDELLSQREALNQKITELRLSLLDISRDCQQLSDIIASLEQQKSVQQEDRLRLSELIGEQQQQIEAFRQQIQLVLTQKSALKAQAEEKRQQATKLMQERTALEGEASALRQSEKDVVHRREQLGLELARLEERRVTKQQESEELTQRLWTEYELTKAEATHLSAELPSVPEANKRLSSLKNQIKNLGSVNVAAIEEYSEVSQRFAFLSAQISDVEKAKRELERLIEELTSNMCRIFSESFAKINTNFSRIFSELFGGGTAKLELSDPSDILESGIEIIASPPGKIIKNLSALSGGEQALIAIAIYFAIMNIKPAPFCVLDEIEAALDDVNVVRYAEYLRRMAKITQFITITHRRGTMEEADTLYGITMQEEGVSKLLELRASEVSHRLGLKV